MSSDGLSMAIIIDGEEGGTNDELRWPILGYNDEWGEEGDK